MSQIIYQPDGSILIEADAFVTTRSQIQAFAKQGVAPFSVYSNTFVANLNVEFLNGQPFEYYLDYNNFTNLPILTFAELGDTNIIAPQNYDILYYDSNNSEWINLNVGEAGEVLTANSQGQLEWQAPAGAGLISNAGTGGTNRVTYWTDASTIGGDANLTWDGSDLRVNGQIGVNIGAIYPIDVYDATADVLVRLVSGDANAFIDIRDVNTTAGYVRYGAVGNDAVLWAGNAERLRIKSDGDINILNDVKIGGAAGDTPALKLHVLVGSTDTNDGIFVSNGSKQLRITPNLGSGSYTAISQVGDQGIIFTDSAQNTGTFVLAPWATGKVGMRMVANGNVTMSTNQVDLISDLLLLSNDPNSSTTTADAQGVALHFDPNGNGTTRSASIKSIQSSIGNYADLRFFTAPADAPAERLRIKSDGDINILNNVKIGGSAGDTPAAALEVVGDIFPGAGSTYDLGSTSLRWNTVYANTVYAIGGLIAGDTSNYPDYEMLLDFGGDAANTWRKIVAIASPNIDYSTIGFKIEITNAKANHATIVGIDNIINETYYVACIRTLTTTANNPDACEVRGPSDTVRAIKTSQGNYEIQVQNDGQYREYRIRISVYASNGSHTVTYFKGGTAGTATATYTASIASNVNSGDYFQNIHPDKVRITNTTDASLSSTDHGFQIGLTSGENVIIDSNEILARNNGAAAILYLNIEGTNVQFGGNFLPYGATGTQDIGTSTRYVKDLYANGIFASASRGSSGQVLTSGGASGSMTWTTPTTGTVTSVGSGTGLTGGPITGSGSLSLATAGAGASTYSSGISAIEVDAYGRVISVTGSAGYTTNAGTVTGTGTDNRIAVWSGTSSLDSDADLTFDGTRLSIGGGSTANILDILATDSVANATYYAMNIDMNSSGTDAVSGGNKTHVGLRIDLDSSATGGTTVDNAEEHQIYGALLDIDVTGDSDLIRGYYATTRSVLSSGQTTNIRGVDSTVEADPASGGTISNAYGGYFYGLHGGVGTVQNLYGSYNRAEKQADSGTSVLPNAYGAFNFVYNSAATPGADSTITNAYGSISEVQVISTHDQGVAVSNAQGVRSIIDVDTNRAGVVTSGYLFRGDYQLVNASSVTNPWGIYLTGSTDNYITGDMVFSDDVKIGGSAGDTPLARLEISGTLTAGGIYIEDSSVTNAAPGIEIIGKRSDGNASQSFGGKLLLAKNYTGGSTLSGKYLGTIGFGGNHTDGTIANILYAASISGISDGNFTNSTTMPTGLAFLTGSTGQDPDTPNVTAGTERMRIDSSGNVGIGTSSPKELLDVRGEIVQDLNRFIGHNLYNDGSWKFIGATGYSASLKLADSNNNFILVGSTAASTAADSAATVQNLALYEHDNNNWLLYTAGTERMRIQSGGDINILNDVKIGGAAGDTPLAPLEVYNPSLGTTAGDVKELLTLRTTSSNQQYLEFFALREAGGGSGWQTAGTRIQSRIDSTYQSWIEFNGTAGDHSISFGAGSDGGTTNPQAVSERMRIQADGEVNILGNTKIGGSAGDTPSERLEVAGGNIEVQDTYGVIYRRNSTQYIIIDNNGQISTSPGIGSYTATNNAKQIIYNATTDAWSGTLHTAGVLGHLFKIRGANVFYISQDTTPNTLITASADIVPAADSTYDLGSDSLYWANTYSDRFISNYGEDNSLDDAAIWLKGGSGAILLDSNGEKRISWNDGVGNFQIRAGHYSKDLGGSSWQETRVSPGNNDGAALINMSSDDLDGVITFKTAVAGTDDTAVSWTNYLVLDSNPNELRISVPVFRPVTDSATALGTTSEYWSGIYTDNVYTATIHGYSGSSYSTLNLKATQYTIQDEAGRVNSHFAYGADNDIYLSFGDTGSVIIRSDTGAAYTNRFTANTSGLYPAADSAADLGTTSLRWANLYVDDITKTSTTLVTNLNADLLDGQEGSYYLNTSTSFGGDVSGTYNAIVVANDSHTHAFNNLTGKTSGTGEYSTSSNLTSGRGSGGVSLTINDGYGNANVTWNHKSGIPEQSGNAARIEVNTDDTTNARMFFEAKSNVTAAAVTLSAMATMYADTGNLDVVGDVTAYSSDKRLKTNVVPITNALDMIDKINGYKFDWNKEICNQAGFCPDTTTEYGVIAQEIQQIMPELVVRAPFDKKQDNNGNDIEDPPGYDYYKTVKYDKLTALLIAAVKELKAEVEELKRRK